MSSSRFEFTLSTENSVTYFGWFAAAMLVPTQMDTDIASHIQNSLNFICSNISHNYKKLQRPESWRGSLNLYLNFINRTILICIYDRLKVKISSC